VIERSGQRGSIYLVCEQASCSSPWRQRVVHFPEADRSTTPPPGQREQLITCDGCGHLMQQITEQEMSTRIAASVASAAKQAVEARNALAADLSAALITNGIDEAQAHALLASMSMGELVGLFLRAKQSAAGHVDGDQTA
jgi:hypothetical protein